ncbi:sulfurtransferase [Neptunomonas japonica]|uniref:Sulfurtransferase n=1 Tax=Neptunomonas japonica JAMM 1380 TaxID=1441457 RepID=A0A7R6PV01_9GAMM|nr:sulfurtransferase [Neptunomonas japonica]BBB31010.1 thiosulfate/3-mercaptopyruvate sulfurtransferase [Neptunomonas japonica JAMM 1380]
MLLPLVINPTQLFSVISEEDLIILDLSSPDNYTQQHICGAIWADANRLLCGTAPVANKLPNNQQLSQLFSDIGITPDSHVAVYDDQNGALAGRFIWTMHCVGLKNASFLNGHLPAWTDAGYLTEQTHNTPTPSTLAVSASGELIADKDYLLAHIKTSDISIWDARSHAEYTGERVVNAVKGGHIPGAHWLEWTDTLAQQQPPLLASPEVLMKMITTAGINPEKTVITHCQTHRRSGLTYIAALHAGLSKVKCYDGSWFEWGNAQDTPVET